MNIPHSEFMKIITSTDFFKQFRAKKIGLERKTKLD